MLLVGLAIKSVRQSDAGLAPGLMQTGNEIGISLDVQKILNKLGFRSRFEVAASAADAARVSLGEPR